MILNPHQYSQLLAGDHEYFDVYDRFSNFQGLIIDHKTNLQWAIGLDQDTSYGAALIWLKDNNSHCEKNDPFRFPTLEEAETIFDESKLDSKLEEHKLYSVFQTTGHYLYLEGSDEKTAQWFGFHLGFHYDSDVKDFDGFRVFAVRNLKEN